MQLHCASHSMEIDQPDSPSFLKILSKPRSADLKSRRDKRSSQLALASLESKVQSILMHEFETFSLSSKTDSVSDSSSMGGQMNARCTGSTNFTNPIANGTKIVPNKNIPISSDVIVNTMSSFNDVSPINGRTVIVPVRNSQMSPNSLNRAVYSSTNDKSPIIHPRVPTASKGVRAAAAVSATQQFSPEHVKAVPCSNKDSLSSSLLLKAGDNISNHSVISAITEAIRSEFRDAVDRLTTEVKSLRSNLEVLSAKDKESNQTVKDLREALSSTRERLAILETVSSLNSSGVLFNNNNRSSADFGLNSTASFAFGASNGFNTQMHMSSNSLQEQQLINSKNQSNLTTFNSVSAISGNNYLKQSGPNTAIEKNIPSSRETLQTANVDGQIAEKRDYGLNFTLNHSSSANEKSLLHSNGKDINSSLVKDKQIYHASRPNSFKSESCSMPERPNKDRSSISQQGKLLPLAMSPDPTSPTTVLKASLRSMPINVINISSGNKDEVLRTSALSPMSRTSGAESTHSSHLKVASHHLKPQQNSKSSSFVSPQMIDQSNEREKNNKFIINAGKYDNIDTRSLAASSVSKGSDERTDLMDEEELTEVEFTPSEFAENTKSRTAFSANNATATVEQSSTSTTKKLNGNEIEKNIVRISSTQSGGSFLLKKPDEKSARVVFESSLNEFEEEEEEEEMSDVEENVEVFSANNSKRNKLENGNTKNHLLTLDVSAHTGANNRLVIDNAKKVSPMNPRQVEVTSTVINKEHGNNNKNMIGNHLAVTSNNCKIQPVASHASSRMPSPPPLSLKQDEQNVIINKNNEKTTNERNSSTENIKKNAHILPTSKNDLLDIGPPLTPIRPGAAANPQHAAWVDLLLNFDFYAPLRALRLRESDPEIMQSAVSSREKKPERELITYADGRAEAIFASGLRKIKWSSGHITVFFANGDIKETAPANTVVKANAPLPAGSSAYYYSKERTVQVNIFSNGQVGGETLLRFANGQRELHDQSGIARVVLDPEGAEQIPLQSMGLPL